MFEADFKRAVRDDLEADAGRRQLLQLSQHRANVIAWM
jgi:hypothetical protein